MGANEIRMRNEMLGNLPGVQRVNTETGAAEAWRALSRLGGQVAHATGMVADAVTALDERRMRREADDLANHYMDEMDGLNTLGTQNPDGSHSPGWMQETPEDTQKWIDRNSQERNKVWKRLTKNVDGRVAEMANRRLAGYNLSLRNTWRSHAAKIERGKDLQTAAATLQRSVAGVVNHQFTDGPDEATAQALLMDDLKTAVERHLDAQGITSPEARARFEADTAANIVKDRFERSLKAQAAHTAEIPPADAERYFDAMEKSLESGDMADLFVPDANNELEGETVNHLKTWLKEDGRDLEPLRRDCLDRLRATRENVRAGQMRRVKDLVGTLIARSADPEANANTTLKDMDEAAAKLKEWSGGLPDDNPVGASIAREKARLDGAADSFAGQLILKDHLKNLQSDPEAKIGPFPEGSRQARLAPQVQEMFDRQMEPAYAQARRENADNLKAYAVLCAAEPAKFRDAVYKAALGGDITLKDYLDINKYFDSAWTKGFGNGNQSPAQLAAQDMVSELKKVFPDANIDGAFKWDKSSGRLELEKGTKYKGFGYKPKGNWFRTTTVGPELVRDLLVAASDFARYDGENLGYDPITKSTDTDCFGDKIDKEKPFNARDYFRKFLWWMKDGQECAESSEAVLNFSAAAHDFGESFNGLRRQNADAVREKEVKRSREIRYRKPPAGTATAK